MENPKLSLKIDYNGAAITINRSYIESNIQKIPFDVELSDLNVKYTFTVWMMKSNDAAKNKNKVLCFARNLRADIDSGKLEYEIDLLEPYNWLITSDCFDVFVDSKGDKIEIALADVEKIQFKLSMTLNDLFRAQIEYNTAQTKKNMITVKQNFHSLAAFIDEDDKAPTNRIKKEADIIGNAIENKGKIEKNYWTNQQTENEDTDKLLNSSLQIYVDHRRRILLKFHELIERFDAEGTQKREPEEDIHDLFLKRGVSLKDSADINHLHNLWILDDKYTVFSESTKAKSTKRGQELSDIYLWVDDQERVKELLILELKSTSNAHNAGDKYESMIAQVKRYAHLFYQDPTKVLNWHVDPKMILYSGIILARKSDIYKELNSNNVSGTHNKIPYLESSYFFNERFFTGSNNTSTPEFNEIRIELYSYEDIYTLSSNRNRVFFRFTSW